MIVLLAVMAVGMLFTFSGEIKARIDSREITAYEDDYLAALRNSDMGCRTLFARRPEVVVIGDSHAYSGLDFSILQQGLKKKVGACTLGGIYADSLPMLVSEITAIKPKRIIVALSPRMFWDPETRKSQMKNHQEIISNLQGGLAEIRDLFMPSQFKGRRAKDQARFDRHAPSIELLEESTIASSLMASPDYETLLKWKNRTAVARHRFADATQMVKKLCGLTRQEGVAYSVIYIPESPYVEAMYTTKLWQSFHDTMLAFGDCAEHIIAGKAGDYGLGNRHFVNRYFDDFVSYEPFRNGTNLSNKKAFDADHMNPIGAALFTSLIVDLI